MRRVHQLVTLLGLVASSLAIAQPHGFHGPRGPNGPAPGIATPPANPGLVPSKKEFYKLNNEIQRQYTPNAVVRAGEARVYPPGGPPEGIPISQYKKEEWENTPTAATVVPNNALSEADAVEQNAPATTPPPLATPKKRSLNFVVLAFVALCFASAAFIWFRGRPTASRS